MIITCAICKKELITYPCRLKQGQGKYCSRKCKGLAAQGRKHSKEHCKKISTALKGHKASNFKGSTLMNGYKYIFKPDHPFSTKAGYVLKSHIVIEEHIGRYLNSGEIVHHIDRNIQNDTITNLQLFPNKSTHFLNHHETTPNFHNPRHTKK